MIKQSVDLKEPEQKSSKSNNLPVSINCLRIINRLKKNKYGKRFFKKRKYKIKAILYGNKGEIIEPNKLKVLNFKSKIIDLKRGPIQSLRIDSSLAGIIGRRCYSVNWK
jgi:hypothetical protein